MSKSNTFENEFLRLVFLNAPITLLGDASGLLGSAAAGQLFVGLATADPGEGATQLTNEATYTGYGRVPVVRGPAGWSVTGNVASPAADISFPQWAGGSAAPLTHFTIGCSATGAGKLLFKGPLNNTITPGAGAVPQVTTDTTITED
jgi:hypothetical protein